MIAYITSSTTGLSIKEIENFLLIMKGHTEGYSQADVSSVFFSLCNDATEGTTLPMETLIFALDTENFPEVAEGFRKFLPGYLPAGADAEDVTVQEFLDIHSDMHASSPDNFNEVLRSVWRF
jgi:hypothetical protein